MDITSVLLKFVLSISLGALMGLERDGSWKGKEELKGITSASKAAAKKFSFINSAIPASNLGGVRTYILISMLGGVAGLAYALGLLPLTWIITVSFIIFIQISFILNYFDKNTFGLTTEISLILNFVLSLLLFATVIPAKIIIAIAVLDTIILSMKTQLRDVVSKFSGPEIVDTMKFVLFTSVILPFMPDKVYGIADFPFIGDLALKIASPEFIEATKIYNPSQIWVVVVLVLGLNFVGYFTTRALGKERSMNAIGLMGGLLSSTAVTEAMARNSKKSRTDSAKDPFIMAAVLANLTSFYRIVFVASLINFPLASMLMLPMTAMSAPLVVWVIWKEIQRRKVRKIGKSKERTVEELGIEFKSPFSLKPALTFAGIYLVVITVSNLTLFYLGDSGFLLSSMISALSGLDAITITTATLAGAEVTIGLGMITLVIAACVNLLVKILFAAISGEEYFRKKITNIFLVAIVSGILAMLVVVAV